MHTDAERSCDDVLGDPSPGGIADKVRHTPSPEIQQIEAEVGPFGMKPLLSSLPINRQS
jgi:hypothetical protein